MRLLWHIHSDMRHSVLQATPPARFLDIYASRPRRVGYTRTLLGPHWRTASNSQDGSSGAFTM